MKKVVLVFAAFAISFSSSTGYEVGDRVLGRWTSNSYFPGKITSIEDGKIHILFNDGDKIAHNVDDVSAAIPDKDVKDDQLKQGDHIMYPYYYGFSGDKVKYYIGRVQNTANAYGHVKIYTDSDKISIYYPKNDPHMAQIHTMRMFKNHDKPNEVGARVFAQWTDSDKCYYHGFVTDSTDTTFHIKYDDGDTRNLNKDEPEKLVLDKMTCHSDIQVGQRVIAYWKNWFEAAKFCPGVVTKIDLHVGPGCYQATYSIKFDDGDTTTVNAFNMRVIQ